MRIPFLDLKAAVDELREEIDDAIGRVLSSGRYLLGQELEAFEAEWASYVKAEHAVGVANGLEALHLSLRACGIGSGDEVIVPSNTYVATWLAVSHAGARPVPVDPDEALFNLDPSLVERAITSRTRAIMPVHLYGQAADLDPILELARDHDLFVIEDAAQCHGARYKGRRIGAHGNAVAWSFYPTKNLGALGDAGAITTNDAELARQLRILRNYGSETRYVCAVRGHNSRLEELHAAVLRVKLAHLDAWNARRSAIANRYLERLVGLPLTLPTVRAWADPVWHLFVVRHKSRDLLHTRLGEGGIGSLIHYPLAPHEQEAYSDLELSPCILPVAERLHREVLSLPCHPHLSMPDADIVVDAIRDVCGKIP